MSALGKDDVLALLASAVPSAAPPLYNKPIGDVDFTGHVFSHPVNFIGAQFIGTARFLNTQFENEANFSSAIFSQNTLFDRAIFRQGVAFAKTVFQRSVSFSYCRFIGSAYFWRARFRGNADFVQMLVYTKGDQEPSYIDPAETNFSWAQFLGEANFTRAKFHGSAYFWRTVFFSKASFEESTFKAKAWFNGTKTDVQISRLEFSNPTLLDDLARIGLLQPDSEETMVFLDGRRTPVFFLLSGIASEKDLVAKLTDTKEIAISLNQANELNTLWKRGAQEMFVHPELVSFRGASFENAKETKFINVNLDVIPLKKNKQGQKTKKDIQKNITTRKRRLRILEEQAVKFGNLCPPHIIMEIEDLNQEIPKLEKRLEEAP